jgi:hypothetical protein
LITFARWTFTFNTSVQHLKHSAWIRDFGAPVIEFLIRNAVLR